MTTYIEKRYNWSLQVHLTAPQPSNKRAIAIIEKNSYGAGCRNLNRHEEEKEERISSRGKGWCEWDFGG